MSQKTISFGFKLDTGPDGLKKLTLSADELRKAMQGTLTAAEEAKRSFIDFAQVSIGIQAIKDSLSSLTDVTNDLVGAYQVQLEAETKIETVMRQRMNATVEEIQSIKDLCSAQQSLGVIGDEIQLAGAQQMATFLNEKSALDLLIPAMNNLVAQQKGFNATSQDAVTVGNMIGKVMQGQTSALKRVGISFDAAQEAALKYGTETERAAVLADIIRQNVGDMNEELNKTPAGKMQQAAMAMGDAKEVLGSMLTTVQPLLVSSNALLGVFGSFKTVSAGLGSIVTGFKNIIAGAKGAALHVNELGMSFTKTTALGKMAGYGFKAVCWTMKTALISTGIGVLLWGIGEAMAFIIDKINGISAAAKEAGRAAANAGNAAAGGGSDDQIKSELTKMNDYMARLQSIKRGSQEEKAIVEELNATYGATMNHFSTAAEWLAALTKNSDTYTRQLQLQADREKKAAQVANIQKLIADRKAQGRDAASQKWQPGMPNTGGLNLDGTRSMGWAEKLYYNAKKEDERLLAMLRDSQQDLSRIAAEAASLKMPAIGSLTGGYVAPSSGRSGKETPPPPEGSIAYFENQISDIEAKIKVTIDPESVVDLENQKAAIQKKLDDFNLNVITARHGGKMDLPKDMQRMALMLDVKIDPKSLASTLKEIPQEIRDKFKPGVDAGDSLQKTLSGVAQCAQQAGSAFSSMGEAFEEPALNVAGIILQAIANMVAGYASASAQSGSLGPWGWAAFSLSGLAQLMAMIQQIKSVTKFASGGIVSGPTMALVGEYAGASNNPEVIAPLNKLRSMLGDGGRPVIVGGDVRVRGADLWLALRNYERTSRKNH